VLVDAKRLLQQHLPSADSCTAIVALFNHPVGEGAAEDRLDVVTIWIDHKCSVAIRPAQTGRSVFGSAYFEGGGVECIDLGSSFGCKGGMLFDGVWVISIDPEDKMIETVADAVSPRVVGPSASLGAFQARPKRRRRRWRNGQRVRLQCGCGQSLRPSSIHERL
jgi:hypothetical protein